SARIQERALAEIGARPEPAPLVAADRDERYPVLDDEESDASLALGRHRVAGLEGALLHARRDSLPLLGVQVREDRHPLQKFGCALCHVRTMPHWAREADDRRVLAGLADSRRRSVGIPRRGVGSRLAGLRAGRPTPSARAGALASRRASRDHALP